jgi:glycosyltransferase involved in cell wall biosynthesis
MKSAEIGISILYPVKNYLTSLPVKTYEYMACSLPVIMSDFPYWKEIFGDFALFANPNNPEDIAQQILFLLEHKDRATELGKKGREFAETRYNWETESKKLLKLYQTILTGE